MFKLLVNNNKAKIQQQCMYCNHICIRIIIAGTALHNLDFSNANLKKKINLHFDSIYCLFILYFYFQRKVYTMQYQLAITQYKL